MKKTFKFRGVSALVALVVAVTVVTNTSPEQVEAKSFLEQTLEKITGIFTPEFPKPETIKGIYMTVSTYANEERRNALLDQMIASGGNALTIDIEHSGGQLAFIPKNEQLLELNPGKDTIDLKEMVETLHDKGIYVIARDVVFNDPYMNRRKPEWRIKDRWGGLWGGEGNLWLDPSKPGAQNYNLMVIQELVEAGVDEIQLDYIRFPSTVLHYLDFHFDEENFNRGDIITDFLKKAYAITQEANVELGVDVFGAAIWGNVDWKIVGQNIEQLSPYVDVIYPMTYPSHVSPGYYGFYDVYYEPYNFVHESTKKFFEASNKEADPEIEASEDVSTEIRPWVQGFAWRVVFNEDYVNRQVEAGYDGGANGYMIWNAQNNYHVSWPSFGINRVTETGAK